MEGLPVPAALLAALLTLLQGLPPARAGNAYRVGWGGHTPRPRVSLLSTTPPPPPQFRGEVGDTGGLSPETPGAGTGGGVADVPVGSPLLSRVGAPGAPAAAFSTTDRGGGGGHGVPGGGSGHPLGLWGSPVAPAVGWHSWRQGQPPPPPRGVGCFPWVPWGCSPQGRGAPPGERVLPRVPWWGCSPWDRGSSPPPPPPQGEGAPCGSPGRGAPHGAVGGGALPAAGVLPPGPSVGVLPVARGCTPRGRGAIPRVTWWGCCPWNGGAGGVGSPGCLDPLAGLGGQQTGGGLGKHLKRK